MALLVFSFAGISTTTGTGWPIVLVALLIGTFVAGFALPPLWLAGIEVDLDGPSDADVGVPYELRVDVRSARAVAARVDALDTGWFRLASGALVVTPARRGVVDRAVVELWCTAPLGLWTWRRSLPITLPEPLHIAPAVADVDAADRRVLAVTGDELTRGVRPYAPGDAHRLVHWPATASAGELMVREREVHEHGAVALIVDIDGADPEVERHLSVAYAYGLDLLAQGAHLTVLSRDGGVPTITSAMSARALGRALARVQPRPAGAAPLTLPADTRVATVVEVGS